MKKILLFLSVFFSFFSLFAEYFYVSSSRYSAMGNTGISDTTDFINYFRNPAAVSIYDENKGYNLTVSSALSDSFNYKSQKNYLSDPDSCFKVQFVGTNISVGMSLDYDLKNQRIFPQENYFCADSVRDYEMDICVAGKVKPFSGGIGVHFSSIRQRKNIRVDYSEFVRDLVRETLLYSYQKVWEEGAAELRAGGIVQFSNFSLGILAEDVVVYKDGKTLFSIDQLKKGISFGLSYNPEKYAKRGRLQPVLFSFVLEGQRVFDRERASFNGGIELVWQIFRSYSTSLRVGYESLFLSFPNGDLTAGLSLRFGDYDLSIDAAVPSAVLAGDFDQTYTMGITFTALF